MERLEGHPHTKKDAIRAFGTIESIEEARDVVHELYEHGERPVVSVPQEYEQALEKGLVAHSTWIPNFAAIAATFGRAPYEPKDETRILLQLELDEEQIEPRFTGPDKRFEGVVIIKGPVPPERIRRLN